MRGFLTSARLMAVGIVVTIASATVAPAVAQDDAPLSGAETDWVGVPPPSDCAIDPPTVDAIMDAFAEPAGEDEGQFPLTIPAETDLPGGEPVDDETAEAVSATMWEAVACLNAGDFGRFFAFLSPAGVRAFYLGIISLLGGTPATPTAQQLADLKANLIVSLAASPTPSAEEERARIDAIREARELPDGRVMLIADGALGNEATIYMVFRLVDEQWMIDAFGQIGEFDDPFAAE